MPDITMCKATAFQCDKYNRCYRNQHSTKPSEYRQAFFVKVPARLVLETYTECDYYWPIETKTVNARNL